MHAAGAQRRLAALQAGQQPLGLGAQFQRREARHILRREQRLQVVRLTGDGYQPGQRPVVRLQVVGADRPALEVLLPIGQHGGAPGVAQPSAGIGGTKRQPVRRRREEAFPVAHEIVRAESAERAPGQAGEGRLVLFEVRRRPILGRRALELAAQRLPLGLKGFAGVDHDHTAATRQQGGRRRRSGRARAYDQIRHSPLL